MTCREFANLDSYDRDLETGRELEHSEKYSRIINRLGGVKAILPYIPYSIEVLQKAYEKDIYFNTLSMCKWDTASGFWCSLGNAELIPGAPIIRFYARHGLTSISNAESVCILKEAARILVENNNGQSLVDDFI